MRLWCYHRTERHCYIAAWMYVLGYIRTYELVVLDTLKEVLIKIHEGEIDKDED